MSDVLGVDILMVDGDVVAGADGDALVVEGRECLAQDLMALLSTARGTLALHPEWGFDVCRFAGLENEEVHRIDFCASVEEAVETDPRVVPGSANCVVRSWDEDLVEFDLAVTPIGETNPLNLVLGLNLGSQSLEVLDG